MLGAKNRIWFSWFAASLLWACASVVPPSGGDKDEQAPRLIKSSPKQGALNVNPKQIVLEFDERISENNLKQELLISPNPGNDWNHTLQNRKLTLDFPKGFAANKTISFKFREGIQDVTEMNKPKDLSLVFSTGNTLDSLNINGKVSSTPDLKAAEGITVGLFPISDTLNLKKNKPAYFTITDKDGTFHIDYLPEEKFRLMAWSDQNKNLIYDDRKEHLAFSSDTIIPGRASTQTLLMSFQDSDTLKLTEQNSDTAITKLYFNKGIEDLKATTLIENKSIKWVKEKDYFKLIALRSKFKKDSIQIRIQAQDSSGNELAYSIWIKTQTKTDSSELKRKIWDSQNKKRFSLTNGEPLIIKTSDKVKIHPTLKWIVKTDSGRGKDIQGIIPILTTKGIEAQIPKSNKTIQLIIPEGWLSDGFEKVSSRDTLYIDQNSNEEGGIIHMAVEKLPHPWIVQLLSEDLKPVDEIANQTKFDFINVKPGNYRLRLIEDLNGNGRWDWCNLNKGQQAEPVKIKPNTILIKANFEIDTISF